MALERKKEKILKGIAASPGVAHGPALVFIKKKLEIPSYTVPDNQRPEEIARFEQAIMETRRQLSELRAEIAQKLGEEEALIFDAHLMVLEDRAFLEETVREFNETGENIEFVFERVASRYAEAFSHIDDAYIKERVGDIQDVSQRVLHNLLGAARQSLSQLAEPRVIAAQDLTPSDTATMDKNKALAIVTDAGSRTSHTVLMARSINVPAVVGLRAITAEVESGDILLVDGFDGVVIVNPSEESLGRYGKVKREHELIQQKYQTAAHLPAQTKDGHRVKILLNIDGFEDVRKLAECGAEGVGLFRTEVVFLRNSAFPDEDQQYEIYRRVSENMAPRPVVIRTLDLGGDKITPSPFFNYQEANPFMGYRAIRFCLDHMPLFKEQLRAILRAGAHGNVKVMYPMIGRVRELKQANAVLEEAKQELAERGAEFNPDIEAGIMIEIPAAAAVADLLAEHCQFFSIGTNDLIQYLLAVDRVNDRVSHLYEPNHPAVMRVLKNVAEAARKKNLPVSVCGEMGGDPLYLGPLIGLGITELSVVPQSLPEIKYLLRNMTAESARELAGVVLDAPDTQEIYRLVRQFYLDHLGADVQMDHTAGN